MGRGTGLGLTIVHTIVHRHEGAVELRSDPGQGTTVTCFFPALAPAPEAERAAGEETPAGNGERVLLVEDEPGLAELNARRLQALGYRVTAERDPVLALAAFRGRPTEFDVVISDHLMPGLLGVDLAREVHDIRPEVPIVLLTGFVEHISRDAIAAAGVQRVVKKPATLRELGAALREVLDGVSPPR
jgi:CheY-like chemotaxis protein